MFKVRKSFFYALIGIISFLTFIIFSWTGIEKNFAEKRLLKKMSEDFKDPILKRVLIENPETLAKEQIQVGNFVPLGVIAGFAGETFPLGLTCPQGEKVNTYLAGCFGYPDAMADRFRIYNQILVRSPLYKGSCQEEKKK